jgi:ammonia channel protein AmtB
VTPLTLNFQHLVLLGIVTSTLHWLLARSKVAEPLWSRTTGQLDALLRCPSCSGFWLGLAAGTAGICPVEGTAKIYGVFAAGLLAMFITPIFESWLLWGLEHSRISGDDDPTNVPKS